MTKVFVVSSNETLAVRVLDRLGEAGYDPVSNWSDNRENRPTLLSSAELRELAQDITNAVGRADVLVSVHDRSDPSRPGSSFWAGYAFAHGIPTVVVGPFNEPALYLPHIVAEEIDDVAAGVRKALALKRFTDAQKGETHEQSESKPTNDVHDFHDLGGESDGSGI